MQNCIFLHLRRNSIIRIHQKKSLNATELVLTSWIYLQHNSDFPVYFLVSFATCYKVIILIRKKKNGLVALTIGQGHFKSGEVSEYCKLSLKN